MSMIRIRQSNQIEFSAPYGTSVTTLYRSFGEDYPAPEHALLKDPLATMKKLAKDYLKYSEEEFTHYHREKVQKTREWLQRVSSSHQQAGARAFLRSAEKVVKKKEQAWVRIMGLLDHVRQHIMFELSTTPFELDSKKIKDAIDAAKYTKNLNNAVAFEEERQHQEWRSATRELADELLEKYNYHELVKVISSLRD